LLKELHSGAWIAERAVDFIRTHDPNRPFYLNIGFQDPHHPHILPYNLTTGSTRSEFRCLTSISPMKK